ncbi:DUF4817 domain-containing protein [Trichonephila clavipes]|nr:DUF4817 domain-containing protein [Trichonephila clavipes]
MIPFQRKTSQVKSRSFQPVLRQFTDLRAIGQTEAARSNGGSLQNPSPLASTGLFRLSALKLDQTIPGAFLDSSPNPSVHRGRVWASDLPYFKTQECSISCQVIYSQFGLAIHPNDHQARRRFVEWAQNEIAVVPDFHKRILFSDEAHFWLNGDVNKQNCHIWSEANPQVYVETPLHPEKLTVWRALWAGGILLQKR